MAGRFALVGAACAALNLAIMYVGTVIAGVSYLIAVLMTCLITIPLSYLFHRRITFQIASSWQGEQREFFRFVASQLLQFSIGVGLLIVLVEWRHLTPMWGSVVMTATMFAYGFIINSTWVFRVLRPQTRAEPAAGHPSDEPLRLLQVSAFFAKHGGGIEVVADRLGRAMARSGMQVLWFAGGTPSEHPDCLEPRLQVEQAASMDFMEPQWGLPFPIWSLRSLRKLWVAVAASDVLHVHDYLYAPTMLAILFAKLRGRPVVLTQHIGAISFRSAKTTMILTALNRSIGRICMRMVDQVVFVGLPVKKYFERFARFRRPALLIPNGVDHEVYRPLPARRRGDDGLRCLFVGRFVERKGMLLIKECAAIPRVHWTFIGWGPLSPAHWSLPLDRVEVLSNLRAEEVVPFFQAADLLVLPSTGEGFPLVVQEALACGTPVLVSTEVAEAFPRIDPSCVFAVELRTPDAGHALRHRIESLAMQRDMLAAVRDNAARLAAQWSWQTCTDHYREIYRSISLGADR